MCSLFCPSNSPNTTTVVKDDGNSYVGSVRRRRDSSSNSGVSVIATSLAREIRNPLDLVGNPSLRLPSQNIPCNVMGSFFLREERNI